MSDDLYRCIAEKNRKVAQISDELNTKTHKLHFFDGLWSTIMELIFCTTYTGLELTFPVFSDLLNSLL